MIRLLNIHQDRMDTITHFLHKDIAEIVCDYLRFGHTIVSTYTVDPDILSTQSHVNDIILIRYDRRIVGIDATGREVFKLNVNPSVKYVGLNDGSLILMTARSIFRWFNGESKFVSGTGFDFIDITAINHHTVITSRRGCIVVRNIFTKRTSINYVHSKLELNHLFHLSTKKKNEGLWSQIFFSHCNILYRIIIDAEEEEMMYYFPANISVITEFRNIMAIGCTNGDVHLFDPYTHTNVHLGSHCTAVTHILTLPGDIPELISACTTEVIVWDDKLTPRLQRSHHHLVGMVILSDSRVLLTTSDGVMTLYT